MKPLILFKHDFTDVDSRSGVIVEHRIRRMFGIAVPLKAIGEKAAAKVGAKNPALWIATFQADKLMVTIKIGSDKHVVGEFDVGDVVDAKRRGEIIGKMKEEGLVDLAEMSAFMRRHPDKGRLAELRQAVAEKLKAMETLKNELIALKAELAGSGG